MRRRDFIKTIAGSVAGWPLVTYAQTAVALLAQASSPRGPRLARAEIPSEYGQRRGSADRRDRQRSAGAANFPKKKSAMAAGADGARRRAKG